MDAKGTPSASVFTQSRETIHSDEITADVEAQQYKASKQDIDEDVGGSGRQLRGISWVLIVATILTSTFLFGLDNTITADVQPAIVTSFDSVSRLPWLSVAFMAAAASTTLFWGVAYGQCNVKWLYISCVTIFEIGSAVCGAAPTMNALIVGRVICGLGGTGMYTGVLTLLTALTDEHERATYFGLSGLVWGIGTVLGPIIGGAFTSSTAGWRWAFYINLVIAAVCAPVYLFMIPSINFRPSATIKERFEQIDILGTLLLIGTFIALLMGISFGGVVYSWRSGQIIALFVVAGVLTAIFLAQQYFSILTAPDRRAFPLHFVKNAALTITFVLECCASTLAYVPIYFIPLFFQFVRQDSAISAGVKSLPLVIFLVVAIVGNGFVMTATGRAMPWFFTGAVLGLIGSALLYTTSIRTSNAEVYGFSILIGTGAGCFIQLPFSVVQGMVSPQEIPKAIGFVTFAQLGAPSLMLAVVNAIFLNEASTNISHSLSTLPNNTILNILSGVGSQVFSSLPKAEQTVVLESIVAGLNKGYIVCMVGGALAVVLSLFLSKGKLWT